MFSLLHVRKTALVCCVQVLRGNPIFFVCVILLFYSETELLHNTAKKVGDENGFDRDKKGGFILVFTLCNEHNCVIKKHRIFFPTLVLLESYRVAHERTS